VRRDGSIPVWSSSNRIYEVVAVRLGVAELPVLVAVARVSSSLEGEGHDPGLVGQGRSQHVLCGVCRWPAVPRSGPSERKTRNVSTNVPFPAFRNVTQRNATQRQSFYATKSVAWPYFLRNRRCRSGAPQANRNDFIFSNAGSELDQSELRLEFMNALKLNPLKRD